MHFILRIGNPQAFAKSVKQCGGVVEHLIEFPDHHAFDANDIRHISQEVDRAKGSSDKETTVLCTGKDLAKVNVDELSGVPLFALEIGLELRYGQETFHERLQQVIDKATQVGGSLSA